MPNAEISMNAKKDILQVRNMYNKANLARSRGLSKLSDIILGMKNKAMQKRWISYMLNYFPVYSGTHGHTHTLSY